MKRSVCSMTTLAVLHTLVITAPIIMMHSRLDRPHRSHRPSARKMAAMVSASLLPREWKKLMHRLSTKPMTVPMTSEPTISPSGISAMLTTVMGAPLTMACATLMEMA